MRIPIRRRLLLWITLPVGLVLVVALGATLRMLEARARTEVEKQAVDFADDRAARIDAAFREVAAATNATAAAITAMPGANESSLVALLTEVVGSDPMIYGAAAAFAPGAHEDRDRFCPYVHRAPEGMATMDIAEEAYDYADGSWSWWSDPAASGAASWSAPYLDDGAGEVLMVTYSVPFRIGEAFAGVATADVALPSLRERLDERLRRLDFVIIDPEGRTVWERDPTAIGRRSILDVARERGRPDVAALAERAIAGQRGVEILDGWEDDERQWVVHAPIPSTGWSFIARVPEREALAELRSRQALAAAGIAMAILLMIACVWLVSGRLARPIVLLERGARRVAGGDLDAVVAVPESDDEVRDLACEFNAMTAELRGLIERRARQEAATRDAVIFAMAKLTESRDDDTGAHLERICRYARILAAALEGRHPDIDAAFVETIATTAALHDIGKVAIPDAVLKKPGRLTEEEFAVIRTHTTIGGDTLMAVRRQLGDDAFLTTACEIAFAHHEKWDGTGYPFGLAGADISVAARIVALADVYDALRSPRVYKPGMTHDEAKRIIVEGRGAHFDPMVVDAFLETEAEFVRTADELLPPAPTG